MNITAIIPAKGTSARLPGKNLAEFGGRSLVANKVHQLKAAARIDRVVVGSDSRDILTIAEAAGAEVRKRDAYHCDESRCCANEMIRDLVSMVECDIVVWAHCTNPLCMPDLYDAAIEAYLGRDPACDSLCSVTRIQRHAWHDGVPLNFEPEAVRHQLASELEPVCVQDGAIFIQPREQMVRNAYFYGDLPVLFEVDPVYGLDIDTPRDLDVARRLWASLTTPSEAAA